MAEGGLLRIGCVKYLNARPLIHGWPGEVVFDHPSVLCERLAAGALDVALVSSFEFLRNPVYTLVDSISISSQGPVHSVFVAHNGELSEIEEIEVDPASQTGVNLLRCLLAEIGLAPKFVMRSRLIQRAITPRLAKFFIGDQAIRFRDETDNTFQFWDLGEEWQKRTQLPFVYALWLIRPELASPKAIADGLRACRDNNLRELESLIAAEDEFSPDFCQFYLRECIRYEYGAQEKEGLSLFRKLCEKHGIFVARFTADHLTSPREAWGRDDLRIGISGWTYAPWRGVFYPNKMPHRMELKFASSEFNSIEINGSFYSLQRPSSYQRWYAETPPGFIFSVKGARFITHMKKLRDIEVPLANFFASGVLCLGEKLGPILWQFPPNFGWNPKRFAEFFDLLPRDSRAAAKLSKNHDDKLKAGAWTKTDVIRPIRHAVEIRHPTFMVPEFFALLRCHNIAFVVADTAGKWPYAEDITADFVYCRLHGAEQLYVSGYSDTELDRWANRIEHWRRGKQPGDAKLVSNRKDKTGKRDVYIYFDNDAKVHAPFNARTLGTKLKLQGAAI